MDTALFDYHLPSERIAQEPASLRDASKLLVVNRKDHSLQHRSFRDLPEFLGPNDFLFRNTAKVLPARLFANRVTGGRVECLLLRPGSEDGLSWWCLLKPGKKLPTGSTFSLEGVFRASVIAKNEEKAEYLVTFDLLTCSSVPELAEQCGKMPLPPYIRREKEDSHDGEDTSRYQTTYANDDRMVAAAAPTAGLHFTPELTELLRAQQVSFYDVVLHVGMGTFKPLEAERVEDHEIHREVYEVPVATQSAIRQAAAQGKRRVCVGTTSVRSIEDYLVKTNDITDQTFLGEADIFIYPPRQFAGVDALITNFHLPKSTLLCLVSSFLTPGQPDGVKWLREIYEEAIRKEYRFHSYGDAMLIL